MTYVETQQGINNYELNQDLTIVENEIKRFIASLHKFFYDLVDCDFERAAQELHEIDIKILKLLDEIDQRQFLMGFGPESFQVENTDDFIRALDFSSTQEDSNDSKRHNTTSRADGITFDTSPQPNKTVNSSARSFKGAAEKSRRNDQTFNASPRLNKTHNASPRLNKTHNASPISIKGATEKNSRNQNFDINNSKDLFYTFGVVGEDVENAENEFERINNQGTNLYRSKNYENLHGLFDFE